MMHYDILDETRKGILPLLGKFGDHFYLAGGTGLALQLGHRDSFDFDFFCQEDFDTVDLSQKVESVFAGSEIQKIQEAPGTLTVIIDKEVQISFLNYPYKLLEALIETEHLRLASIADIAAMKVSAIISRASKKDYVDLYFILDRLSFDEILSATQKKLPSLDENLIRKSLVYFDDVRDEGILYKIDSPPSWEEVQTKIRREVIGQ